MIDTVPALYFHAKCLELASEPFELLRAHPLVPYGGTEAGDATPALINHGILALGPRI